MKKYLKSILCLILALALVFAVAACGDDEVADDDDEDEEEAKEKDKDEKDDEDDEDDKDDDKKSSSKKRELIGKTKAEKAAEEAFYEWADDAIRYFKNQTIGNLYDYISGYEIPQDCVDEHLDYCIDFIEDYFDEISFAVTSVDEEDSSTVEIEYDVFSGFDDLEDDRYIQNLLDLLEDREEYDDDEFIEEFNEIMEDIKAHREDILKYPSEADASSESMTMYKEDGEWTSEGNEEASTEAAYGARCDFCDCYTEELYYYDGRDLCWDCYYDEAYDEEATEAASSVSGWCDWCDSYDDDLYCWDGDYICEDCWYSF